MTRNMAAWDAWLRIGLGTAMVTMWVFGPLGLWGALGLFPLITGLRGTCPVYALLGTGTRREAPGG